jgi:hypothetical protein
VGFQAWVLPASLQSRSCPPLQRLSPGSRGAWRAAWDASRPDWDSNAPSTYRRPTTGRSGPTIAVRRLAAADRQGIADPVVVVGSTAVVVGPVVGGSVLVVVTRVVVVGAAVVVGSAVGDAVVVVGPLTGGWVLVAPKVENASLLVVAPAVVGTWPLTGPAALVGLLRAPGPVAEVVVERVGTVVGARGTVGGADVGLGAGSVGTVGRARAGARCGGDGWGSRVAEATRAARTPVVSPKATSSSRQGHRDLVTCRGGDGRCRGGGVDMAAFALSGAFDKCNAIGAPNLGSPARPCAHARAARQRTRPRGRHLDDMAAGSHCPCPNQL